jgi:glycosyltransferase involved in cell wall biosynthesis
MGYNSYRISPILKNNSNIIIFIDWYLPGIKAGGPIKSIANLIEAFHAKYNFHIITGDRDFGDKEAYSQLNFNKWINKDYYKIIYLTKANQTQQFYNKLIDEIKPDYIYINGIFSANFSIKPLLVSNKKNVKTILAPRGMIGAGALAIKPHKKKLFLFMSNFFGWYNKIIWHATSLQEKEEIKKVIGKKSNVLIASNLPVLPKEKRSKILIKDKGTIKLVFISRISKKKNIDFLLNLIHEFDIPGIDLDIYGPIEDDIYYQSCNLLIKRINSKKQSRITYKGMLEWNQIPETIVNYHFFVLPTLNENFSHAIFEALAEGVPLLISNQTPWQNLEQKNIGFDLPLVKEQWKNSLMQMIDMENDEYQLKTVAAINFAYKWYKEQNFDKLYLSLFN